MPELDIGFYDWVLVADHLFGESWVVATGLPTGKEADARARLAGIQERLRVPAPSSNCAASPTAPRLRSNFRRADYLRAVERAREYIAAGDIFQVNLSHRLEGEWSGAAWRLYERLRAAGQPMKVARCAAARKLLHRTWAVVTKGKPYEARQAQQREEGGLALAA